MTPKESKPKSPPATTEEGNAAQCATPFEISSKLQTALQVRFKLTESQIRVYTALLIMGQLTADGISNYSGVPMVKVRSTLETLEKKQLIKPLPGVVTRYRAFAPYQELSKEVQTFSKDTQKSWKELQKLQSKTLSEIHDELQLMTRQVRSALENLNERQGIALNEAAMATNIVLSNVAETLQKSLNSLSSLSLDEISEQNTSTQQALNSLIDEGISHLDDAQKLALEDATKAISAHQEDSKQWISATADQLLARVTESKQQISTHLDGAKILLQRTMDTGRNAVNTEITSQKEGLAESTEETAVTLTSDIDAYTKETNLVFDTSQKEITQALQKLKQDLTTLMQETWTQQTQSLSNLVSQLEQSIKKENRRFAKQTDETTATMDSTIKSSLDTSEQIIEGLFQDLKKAHNHSSLELRRLHKEAEETVTKWPPSSLSYGQFSKIRNSVSTLLEQVKTEHDALLENASQSISSEMRDSYLAQLVEVQTLLQSLIAESKTQKRALTSNFKSISNQIGRRLKRRLRTIQKASEAFLSDFRSQMELQEEQHHALSNKMQKLLRTEAAASINALEMTASQLGKYAANQLKYAQGAIKQSAADNRAQATREQKVIDTHSRAFKGALTKITNKTASDLQKELAKLENIVRQYSEGIESTADKLRTEQILKVETVIEKYQPAIPEIQTTRDRALGRAIRSLTSQLTKRDQEIIGAFNTVLLEDIPIQTLTALNEYQAFLQRKKGNLETQAITASDSVIAKQLTATKLKSFNTQITKQLSTKLDALSASFQESLATQQSVQDEQSDTALGLARDEFVERYSQQISNYNELAANSFNMQMKPLLRDCKTKISRQTKREKQIDKLCEQTLEKLLELPKTVLAREKKTARDKITKELETIFQDFRAKLVTQTNREKQITQIIQSSLESLEALPRTILSGVSEQHIDQHISDLLTIFVEYQTALERQHLTNRKRISAEFQTLLKQIVQADYAKSLKTQLNKLLKKSSGEVLEAYRIRLSNEIVSVEVQAEDVFQTQLVKQLRTQFKPKLREYSTTQIPSASEPVRTLNKKLTEIIQKYDSNSRSLVEKYWFPLTKIIDDYSAVVAGNLTALNTATGTAIDQATVNLNTSLTNFEDDTNNLLTITVQAFNREKSGINDQINKSITEMQEDCIAQFIEIQTLLETLSGEISSQKDATTAKLATMKDEIENSTTTNLTTIQESADTFVENVQTELQTQEARVNNLKKNVQDLIKKQGGTLIESVDKIQTRLTEFSKTEIPKAQNLIEEIGQTCATRIDEQRITINQLLETFADNLTEETDDYVSTLRQELVQLQTVISKLVEKIGETTVTIDSELNEQIEENRVNLLNALNAQQTALSTETSATLQSYIEQSRMIQTQLHKGLRRIATEGKETLEQKQTELKVKIDNTVAQNLSKSEATNQSRQEALQMKSQTMITQLGENLTAFGNGITTSSDQISESLTSMLTNSQTELDKLFTVTREGIDENHLALQNEIGQDVETALQSQTKATDLTQTRLKRATQDSVRRMQESLQNFKSTASTELLQKSKTMSDTIDQVLDNAQEGLVTQTQQTGRRISRTLSKERQTLKTEYQNLAKEITARAKTAETTAINILQLFSAQTLPTLDQLRTRASQTEEILIGLWDTLTKMEPAEAERTWRIVTCQGIENHLLDMFRRVDETITLVYPSFDEVPVAELSKIQPQSRVHIITTLDGEKQIASARKLLQQGNIRLWNNPNMEFYGGSRDGEEVLIAPTYGNQGEIVAVVSDQASYIALFNQTLGPRWISASNEIRPRS